MMVISVSSSSVVIRPPWRNVLMKRQSALIARMKFFTAGLLGLDGSH
jgi:hypothetical protein